MRFDDYSRTFLHFHTKEIPRLLRAALKDARDFRFADLGAGDGALLIALQMSGLLDAATARVAVDVSPDRCARLERHTDFTVICSDATAIPELPDSSFDFVCCTQLIEHVDEARLLSEIRRLLKPDGTLYIASVIKKWYGWWYYRTADGRWALDPTHLREYPSREAFERVVSNGGFRVTDTSVTALKLSVVEFLARRVIVPLFKPRDVNGFFLRHPVADSMRRTLTLHPPGYHIVECIAKKDSRAELSRRS